jgi:nitrogen PTS system EIIA component
MTVLVLLRHTGFADPTEKRKRMELKIQDVMELLQVSESELRRWIRDNRIPVYKIGNQYRFNRAEISDWIVTNNIPVSGKILNFSISRNPVRLTELVRRGGIHHGIEGETIAEVIRGAVEHMVTPSGIEKSAIVSALLQREDLMPTAIGNGIAVPHPRNPLIADAEDERIAICFPRNRLSYKALDGIPIHTLFIVLSATPKRHLEMLSKLSYLCQQEEFVRLLDSGAKSEALDGFIAAKETEWQTGDGSGNA